MSETKKSPGAWLLGFLFLGAFVSFCILVLAAVGWAFLRGSRYDYLVPGLSRVALLEIEGPIYRSEPILDQLDTLTRQAGVKAIVIRLESPGGSVVAAQEVHNEIRRIREEGSQVVLASLGNMAASGAYYIACAADRIVANPGTLTGSIGVIASWTQYDELLRWARLKSVVFKSGPFKDAGSPTREMTPEEAAYHQQLVEELHEQFVLAVAEARSLPVDQVRLLADGRLFTGLRARELDLVDEIGSLPDAIRRAAELAGIEGRPRVVSVREAPRLDLLDLLEGRAREWLGLGGGERGGWDCGYRYLWLPAGGAAAE